MIDYTSFMEETEIDLETEKELYSSFLQDLEQQRSLLQKNMEENHLPGVLEVTHGIKGIAGTYHAWQLEKQAAFLEQDCQDPKMLSEVQCNQLMDILQATIQEILEFVGTDKRI